MNAIQNKTKNIWWRCPELIIPIFVGVISIPWWPNILSAFESKNIPIVVPDSNPVSTVPDTLRPLDPLETGKFIDELPDGVYFFGSAFSIIFQLEDMNRPFLKASNQRLEGYSFEIQKINKRYYLVGYISDEIYAQLGSLSPQKSLYGMLFPISWGGATHPVAIPFDQIYTIRERNIDLDASTSINIADIGFKEVKDLPVVHSL